MDKVLLKSLLQLCESDRERECLRYAVVKSSGLSTTQARQTFGFQNNMSSRLSYVDSVIKHAQYIRESIEKLCRTKEKALLRTHGRWTHGPIVGMSNIPLTVHTIPSRRMGYSDYPEDDYPCSLVLEYSRTPDYPMSTHD